MVGPISECHEPPWQSRHPGHPSPQGTQGTEAPKAPKAPKEPKAPKAPKAPNKDQCLIARVIGIREYRQLRRIAGAQRPSYASTLTAAINALMYPNANAKAWAP